MLCVCALHSFYSRNNNNISSTPFPISFFYIWKKKPVLLGEAPLTLYKVLQLQKKEMFYSITWNNNNKKNNHFFEKSEKQTNKQKKAEKLIFDVREKKKWMLRCFFVKKKPRYFYGNKENNWLSVKKNGVHWICLIFFPSWAYPTRHAFLSCCLVLLTTSPFFFPSSQTYQTLSKHKKLQFMYLRKGRSQWLN